MSVVVVMGVSGSGKTTVGRALASAIGARFFDADDFHPAASVAKMRSGQALTSADRDPWLRALRAQIDNWLADDVAAVLACSALTARSRELLGVERCGITLAYLSAAPELLVERMQERVHFMPVTLLESQLATLEPPAPGEALVLDAAQPVETIVERIAAAL